MKILILYYTQSKNTQKIASYMSEALNDFHEVDLCSIKQVQIEKISEYNCLFLGAPCHHSTLAKKMLKFMQNLPNLQNLPLVGFFTHSTAMPEVSEHYKKLYDEWAGNCQTAFETTAKDKNCNLIGTFHCQGSAIFPIELFIHSKIITDKEKWKDYKKELRTHPDESDQKKAQQFALRMVEAI
ncbi:hypothetical protein NEF87_000520 [Candidatus Lokiarchaeum ossiferum]|uniref:Flavodoxin-like domain-containing protein n=1 Tax=Candidatus Lokiarchaeum ossiferum TaxID=2951803 RepID=A0ABY6HL58_9ARCH|nr:hypothetical protein NEF87_000520 [Candidatus Lokiarchaeum sp. B-35]